MKKIILLACIVSLAINVQGQNPVKKPLDHNVYPHWKTLKNIIISPDGAWVSYEVNPLKGDGWLFLVNRSRGIFDSVARGYEAVFSPESDYLAFKIRQPADTIRKLKLAKKKEDDLPKDSVGIWTFRDMRIRRDGYVKSFSVPEKSGVWMAYLLEEKKEAKDKKPLSDSSSVKKDTSLVQQDTLRPKTQETKAREKKKKSKGNDLIIIKPSENQSITLKFVKEFKFSENGSMLCILQGRKDSLDSVAVVVFDPEKVKTDSIYVRPGQARNLCVDRLGTALAFHYTSDTSKIKQYSLMLGSPITGKVAAVADSGNPAFRKGWGISENRTPWFSYDGNLLYFGTALMPAPEAKDTLTEEEKLVLDLWSWTDQRLQPQQLKDLNKDKKKSFHALYSISGQTAIQICDSAMDDIRLLKKNSKVALGFSDEPYQMLGSWESPDYRDVFIVNLSDGSRTRILEKFRNDVSLSPGGSYMIYYQSSDSSWNVYDVAAQQHRCLTCGLNVQFADEENDTPDQPSPYGIAAWGNGDGYVLVYDRYDIWKIDPRMIETPVNLTGGRYNKTEYRYVKTDPDADCIMPGETLLLETFGDTEKNAGFAKLRQKKDARPEHLLSGAHYYSFIRKASKSDKILFSRQDFNTYPDVEYCDLSFKNPVKISNANPQKSGYLWGNVSLVKWKAYDGITLEGLLYTPENMDSTQKYPVIVYFYEKYSNQLHQHWIPSPSRSIINPAIYASNGYVVFIPDIVYKTGMPGESAYNCVLSGTDYITTLPFVDKSRIGIQGQSWGGYQVAYLVTRTSVYKAAMAGAAVSNMVSAYGGIRWESGMSRMFQYEEGQSRIGCNLWENRDFYINNSPVFFADRITTPLLMMNNDADGAVPWYQGIELFTALRRLGKPVWMLNYNGDAHNLEKWPNRIDLSIRMMSFFDHYLKDKPMPLWMQKGIPALDKGKVTNY